MRRGAHTRSGGRRAGVQPSSRGTLAGALTLVLAMGAVACGSPTGPADPTTTGTAGPGGTAGTSAPTTQWVTVAVDVAGTQISVSCRGEGTKTVVFLSGLAEDASSAWRSSRVPDAVADGTRACTYDRPGLGSSGASAAPRTVAQHVAELDGLVGQGAIAAPVVLVAQGYGTFIARQFAKEHVRAVAGMVLIDPPLDVLDATPPAGATPGQLAEYASIAGFNADLGSFGAGALPPPPAPTIVLGAGDEAPLPPDAPAGAPTFPTAPIPADANAAARRASLRAGQAQLARKSPFGSFADVEGSGPYIQYWNPDAVIKAVETVVSDARGGR